MSNKGTEPKRARKVPVVIDPQARELMFYWTQLSEAEVGWVFKVDIVDQGEEFFLWCHSPALLKQKVQRHGLHFSFDPAALLEWQEKNLEFGQDGRMSPSSWGTGHSHDTAAVHFSAEDHELVDDHGGSGYYVNLVVNKKRDLYCRVDTFVGSPYMRYATRVEVPCAVEVGTTLGDEARADAAAEFKKLVEYTGGRSYTVVRHPGRVWDDDDDWWSQYGNGSRGPAVCGTCNKVYAEHQKEVKKPGVSWHTFVATWGGQKVVTPSQAKTAKRKGHAAKKAWKIMQKAADSIGSSAVNGDFVFFKPKEGDGGVYFYADGKVKVHHSDWKGPSLAFSLTKTTWKEIAKIGTPQMLKAVKEVSLVP